MSLFQKAVVAKYLQSQNKELLSMKWNDFKNHFHNLSVQEDIKSLKEEQYQGEFLEDFFVKILGYTKPASSSEIKFNLTTEYKNVKDSKKADGAIIVQDKVVAVIELKGTNTTDLGKIESQAFGYKNNQPDCIYVITSNFEKLRFYIDNAIEHLEFNLFTLTEEQFQLLFLCLGFENLSQNIAKKIKDESLSEEDVITKKLYKDYSLFKRELHQNLVILNPDFDPLELFKKSQKLLDRFLFLFFGEDRHLLPPNSVRLILSDWKDLQERDVEIPLYDRFKKYFEYLNIGYKGKRYDVFAYNGGLFKPDEILDAIKIDDELLFRHTNKLAEYDFASEVDVNILGHIFENSLNELDEIKAQLEGQEIDKSKTKRKKDGVFYTPKYITKYIVDNTIGKLCTEKKAELNIIEEDYFTDKKRTKTTKQPLLEKLTNYRNWLLKLTICDPACGSGAFLNQALDFLITEHKYIDELQAKLFGDAMILSDVEKSILENNLFGVDLNDESVEIAKLSLWLRTAQPNRKLNDLNNNIKCGNSLIDDVEVAGDKAFNWQTEFPKIFEKGGFDVIIGNPPYVNSKGLNFKNIEKEYYYKNYKTAIYQIDTYLLFLEKIKILLNSNGLGSYIIPNSWLNNLFLKDVRKFVLETYSIDEIVNTPNGVFADATVDTIIITVVNKLIPNNIVRISKINNSEISISHIKEQQTFIKSENYNIDIFSDNKTSELIEKIDNKKNKLKEFAKIGRGVGVYHKRVGHTKEIIANDPYQSNIKKDETFVPYLRGKNIGFYSFEWNDDSFISYGNWLAEPREIDFFEGDRIVLRQIPSKDKLLVTFLNEGFIIDQSVFIARFIETNLSPKYILSILGSKLMSFYFKNKYSEFDDLFPKVKLQHFKDFPIQKGGADLQTALINKADFLLTLNKQLKEQSHKFQRTIQRKFELEDLPKKLQDWYLLTYPEFIKELAKKKVKLSLSQEAEWEDYFIQESKKALELKASIDTTDKAIDKMVYELYDLSEEEIEIVEES